MTLVDLDKIAGFGDFSAAMTLAGWVVEEPPNSLLFKNFLEFNEPACLRAQPKSNAERQQAFRDRQKQKKATEEVGGSGPVTRITKRNDREEKRREDIKKDPPKGSRGGNLFGVLEGERSGEGEMRPTRTDPYCQTFEEAFSATHRGARYPRQSPGDFVQLNACKKAQGGNISLGDWQTAVANYFATPQDGYTLADLASRYATFLRGPLDRFGRPLDADVTVNARDRRTIDAVEEAKRGVR